ncbi:MAG: AEC family transporter [Candidatus Omnitrophica bacterium]|nr:AEC family transporter [Candidatus Omnitrophota bacterium]
MDFFNSLSTVVSAMAQLIFLAGCGYFLVKKDILTPETLKILSRIVLILIFPSFVFHKLVSSFTFSQFPHWWIYPIFSFAIIGSAFLIALAFLRLNPEFGQKREFLSSITFSNAGYLPLVLIATLFDKEIASRLFIYLFLFLLGFNLLVWSFGVTLLAGDREEKNTFKNMFSPPVIAILLGLMVVFFKISSFIPSFLMKAFESLGSCTLPLALIVVGGNLALINMQSIFKNRQLQVIVFIKLILLPFLAIFILLFFDINPLIKFLLLLEAAMPTAVSLSVICRNFELKGVLANQAIFWTHLCSILTLPFFLVIFRAVARLH